MPDSGVYDVHGFAARDTPAGVAAFEQIIADADLDLLGCDDFITRNDDLRAEMATYGQTMTDEAWYASQLEFLQGHRYFTAAADALRAAGKVKNAQWLHQQLAKLAVGSL